MFNKGLVPDKLGWVVSMISDRYNNQTVTYQGLARRLKVSEELISNRLSNYDIQYRDNMTAVPFFQIESEADDFIEYLRDIYLATYMVEAGKNV